MSEFPSLGIRWTVGDVSAEGFDALRLSIHGAHRIFGSAARYVVCVNTVSVAEARTRTGPVPAGIVWRGVGYAELPPWLHPRSGDVRKESVPWQLAPVRVFHETYELALGNDCVLWDAPDAVVAWLNPRARGGFLIAEDARRPSRLSGSFGPEPRGSGIRGLPPHYDYEAALRGVLGGSGVVLDSELDERGLHVATLERAGPLFVVTIEEVPMCSPFWPHSSELGTCGAQFVGLNAHELPWKSDGQPASDLTRENFRRLEKRIERILDLPEARPLATPASRATPAECARGYAADSFSEAPQSL